MNEDSMIQEQIQYYRQRAPEYDETSSPSGDPFAPFGKQLEVALHDFRPTGNVLEIASGTGTWTKLLLDHADAVTALDAAPEMHEASRAKLGLDDRVTYVEADVLSWEPDDRYDVVFFANWLSHVPPNSFDNFWGLVATSLAPGGRVAFVDEIKDAWRNDDFAEEFIDNPSTPLVRRPLRDGRTFNVVKVFWDPQDLEQRLAHLQWNITVHEAGPFYWGQGSRADPARYL